MESAPLRGLRKIISLTMALSNDQQTLELIKQSKAILITFKNDWTGDALAGALALTETLKKLGKQTDIACADFHVSPNLSFLPASQVKNDISSLQKFIISIDTTKTKVGEFNYDSEENRLNIYITPEGGEFNPQDVTMTTSNYRYDLIIILDSPDLESLGGIYERHADFFYNTSKINLDHSNKNEYFGNINLVNLTAAASCEIVYELIKEINESLIDENIATYLLAGIITATKNFKTAGVTPKTLNLASLLIAKGARREQIVQNLYQSRYISTLKLWGRVLSRLNNDLDDKLVWSILSHQDFLETSTAPEELIDVIDELIVSMPKTEVIALIYEFKRESINEIRTIVYSAKNINALKITEKFNSFGNQNVAKFALANVNLAEAERLVLAEIKNKIQYPAWKK